MTSFNLTAPPKKSIQKMILGKTTDMWSWQLDQPITVGSKNEKPVEKQPVSKPVNQPSNHKHCQQDILRDVIRSGCHVLITGQAGTGKTQASQNVAFELGLDYYPISVGEQTTKSDLLGYCSPVTGEYVTTPVRQAFEFGGILLLDEIDAGNANTLTILNALLANNICSFPDGTVRRHEDFYVIASANTFCNGADRKYVGRNKLDGAFLDRFVMIGWTLDQELEESIAMSILPDKQKVQRILSFFRNVRDEVESKGLDLIVSTRAVIATLRMIVAGFGIDIALDIALRNKLDKRTRDILENHLETP